MLRDRYAKIFQQRLVVEFSFVQRPRRFILSFKLRRALRLCLCGFKRNGLDLALQLPH